MSTQQRRERAWVEVDLRGLVSNARTALSAARGAGLLPMVKADAYGLGAVPVARALEALEPWGYGVATVDEGIELRQAGIRRPIVVFTPAQPAQQPAYRTHELRAVLDDPAVAAGWQAPFHLEIDTGMARAGIRWDEPDRIAEAVASPRLEGVFTHFHSADANAETVRVQWKRFEAVLRTVSPRPRLVHAANSAAIWRLDQRLDLVRPGVFLYGGRCAGDLPAPNPVVSLRARIVSLRTVRAGESVSYGATWHAQSETVIGTIGVGYADGVPRSLSGRGQVLLRGRRCTLVGRVTMDMTMVELPPALYPTVRIGEAVTLLGSDGEESITVDEFAARAGTIAYEVLTGLGRRLAREYQ